MIDPQSIPEEARPEELRPDTIENNNNKYVFEKVLGKGTFGFVYLYKNIKKDEDKIAIKVENIKTVKTHGSVITKESYYLRMLNENKNCDKVIRYYGDGFVMGTGAQYIKLEYCEHTPEKYLEDQKIYPKLSII